MDEVYAWVEDKRAQNQQQFRRLLEQGRTKWTPTSIFNRCCVKWLMDGPKQVDHYSGFDDDFFDEYHVRSGCQGQSHCKRDHPSIALGYDAESKSTIATLSHKLDPFVTYFDGLVAEGKATRLPHSVYRVDGFLRPNITSLRSHHGFGNHLISVLNGSLEASDADQAEELKLKESEKKKPRISPPASSLNDQKPAAVSDVQKNKAITDRGEFSDDEEWTAEDIEQMDRFVSYHQSFEEVMSIVKDERLQYDLQNDFMSLYSMRCVNKSFKKMATLIASEKLKTLNLSVTPLVNGKEQYGECKIDGYDSESWDALWQMWGEPTDVCEYTKRARVELSYHEDGENGADHYPIDDATSTFSWNSGSLSLDAEQEDEENRSSSADYAYRGQLLLVYWHPSQADPIKGKERVSMYGEGKPSLGILVASFYLHTNSENTGLVSRSQNGITIDYEVLECNTSKTEEAQVAKEEDGSDEEDVEHFIEYSGKIRIAKISVDFGLFVRKHAAEIKKRLAFEHSRILNERPLTHTEKEYKSHVAAAAAAMSRKKEARN
ncbi:hypothetical protein ACHAWO_001183 [Cyclotella atomus]|uniref:Uncharacterized protein n=1 Tax=Cyclotella atomus TaxID=382360 RepID=A0ABD3NG52_9STRA